MEFNNLILVGTSHIAKESIKEVEQKILDEKPDIVCLELDRKRYHALMSKKKQSRITFYDVRRIGIKGFIFSLIGAWAEKKLGNLVGVSPGSEMVKAIRLAKKNKIKIALIDQDIEVTLQNFSKSLTWKEKWNFLVDLFNAFVLRKKEMEPFDLNTVPSEKLIKKMIGKVKKRYPNIYKVLIVDRNRVMAKKLKKLMLENSDEKILAIIGAGHEKEIIDLINKIDITYSLTPG